jgi:hypothetical protein
MDWITLAKASRASSKNISSIAIAMAVEQQQQLARRAAVAHAWHRSSSSTTRWMPRHPE